jgi:hypothetical protein
MLGSGIEGLFDAEPWQPNIQTVWPLAKTNSKFNSYMSLDEEYVEFLERYESTVLVAFGTFFKPTKETIDKITYVVKSRPDIGFIWSLKTTSASFQPLAALNLPNLLLKPFIP